jgi:hypothetical protein
MLQYRMPRINTKETILARINVTANCHVWTGKPDKFTGGYGKVNYQGKEYLVHRLVAEWNNIDTSGVIRHSCDNPLCCNPDHLLAGSALDNIADKIARRRHRHMFSDDDVRFLRNATLSDIEQRFGLSRRAASHAKWRAKNRYKHVI